MVAPVEVVVLVRLLVALLVLSSCHRRATPYDLAAPAAGDPAFFAREQHARWLLIYDTLALTTTDHHRNRGGAADDQVVCYDDQGEWFCAAGRYDGARDVFEGTGQWRVGGEIVDSDLGEASRFEVLARAVNRASAQLDPAGAWARYPREQEEAVEVWALRAWQPEESPVLGDSWRFTLDAAGDQVARQDHWQRTARALEPNQDLDLTLQSDEIVHPTVGELFFALYHREAFKSITIETRQYRVTLSDLDGVLGWARAAR